MNSDRIQGRRRFLGGIGAAAVYATCVVPSAYAAKEKVAAQLQGIELEEAVQLFEWLDSTGWLSWLKLSVDPKHPDRSQELFRPAGKTLGGSAATRWVEPGQPGRSLLYHALASPSVLPAGFPVSSFPDWRRLDELENFISRVGRRDELQADECLAVFAYEYRPPRFTPHQRHHDLVFSRTGIAHVGDSTSAFDPRLRCHSLIPSSGAFAVAPARYGLFVARRMGLRDAQARKIALGPPQSGDDSHLDVLVPVRKVCAGDVVLQGASLKFLEHHQTDKLHHLFRYLDEDGVQIDRSYKLDRPPFIRRSTDSGDALVSLEQASGSVWVVPSAAKLLLPAEQDGRPVWFPVPAYNHSDLLPNRRYGTLKLVSGARSEVTGAICETLYRNRRNLSLRNPRNAPLFANIRYRRTRENSYIHLKTREDLGASLKGGYEALAFVDNMCEGTITIEEGDRLEVLPAFSIVTAPDFIPLASGSNLRAEARWPLDPSQHFLEGDVTGLNVVRLPPPPDLPAADSPRSNKMAFPGELDVVNRTVLEVVSPEPAEHTGVPGEDSWGQSHLPDSGSGIFYPGWDATYAGLAGHGFVSTRGLGSPFAEDLKLCAAANGMWPLAAPDAARTYQGSLTYPKRAGGSPTAIPLLDEEIGRHPRSPWCRLHSSATSPGWDGEYGPFLADDRGRPAVDYANIERVDYVESMMASRFRPDLLRALDARTLIARMRALEHALDRIQSAEPRETNLWLVHAFHVPKQGQNADVDPATVTPGQELAFPRSLRPLAPKDMFDATPERENGGLVFVFAQVDPTSGRRAKGRRLRMECLEVNVCRIAFAKDGEVQSSRLHHWYRSVGWSVG